MAELLTIEPQNGAEDVIETLEQALETARKGEASAVAVVFVYRDGMCGHQHSALPSTVMMLGAIDRLRHKLNLWVDNA